MILNVGALIQLIKALFALPSMVKSGFGRAVLGFIVLFAIGVIFVAMVG